MSYRNDDDNNPFKDIAKFFNEIQRHLMDSIQNGEVDPNNMMKQYGFSIHIGPDGIPHIQPIGDDNNFLNQEIRRNVFEDPFVDVFYNENNTVLIIFEIPGIDHLDLVHLTINGNKLELHTESGSYKYKKSILLKHELDETQITRELRNGVLEVIIPNKP